MSVFTKSDNLNVATISDIKVVNSNANNVEYDITFKFKEITTVLSNVTNAEIYVDTAIDNDVLEPFVETLTRDRLNFKTPAQYINYINNIQNSYEQIQEILELERSNVFNYRMILQFDPRESLSNSRADEIIRDRLARQQADAGGTDPADINVIDINTFEVIKRFEIAQESIKKGFFQLKCIICAPQDDTDFVHAHQFIIKKVDHDLLAKMFRTDLPAPIVKVAKPITYGSNKFQISFDETQLPINKFPFVKGVRVLRRQLDDSNNAINDFVLLDEIMFAEGDLTQSGIFMALSYNFIDTSVNNYRAQQYRVVPINAQKENGIRFTDAKINQLINPDNTIKNQTQSLNSNVLLDGVQSQIAKEVSITVSNIALGIESASLKRRNMTSVEREHKIIDIKKINNSSVSFTDKTAQINMIYEYIVDLKDMRDNTVSSDNVFLIKILPESQKKAIKTEIINPRVVKHSNRFDIIAVGLEPPTITSQLATKIKAAILSPGGGLFPSPSDSLKEAYEDILKQEEFTENVGFVPIHKVSRINMTTNQLEMSKFIEGNTYTEADTLNSAHDYQYKVETAVVDIDKIIKGISDPKLFETIGNVEKETGTLPPTNSTFTESEILDKSLGLQQVIVPFNSKQNTVEIQNLVANKINKKNISIKWRMNDIGKRVDYLVVERKYDDFNFTTIGNTVEKYFTDVLTPELETSRLEYRITPILTSGGSGIAASVIIQEKKAKKLKSSSRFVSSKARIQTPSATITMADTAKQIDDKRNKSKDIENEKV